MTLYHVITTYHLLNAYIHCLSNPSESILLVPNWFHDKFSNFDELENLFSKIIEIDVHYRFRHSKKESDKYFKSQIKELNDCSDKYVWGSQYSFGIFLAENDYSFIYCEEGAGVLSRSWILEGIDQKLKAKHFDFIKKLGLFDGTYINTIAYLCNVTAQIKDFVIPKNVIDFDVITELAKLSFEERKRVISFFTKYDNIHIPQHATILLTQHFANLRILSFEDQILIYQMFVDYFLPGKNLVIKPHPDDLMYYS